MAKYNKMNIVYHLQKWMDSVPGQTFLNYAYSWGAAVVILGTLFKLTHLPGANLMLFLGMGTEVVVFFLSAFDRPFDKTAEGRELPTHLPGEEPEGEAVEGQVDTPVVEVGERVYVGPVGSGTITTGGQPSSSAPLYAASAQEGALSGTGAIPVGTPFEPDPELAEAQSSYVEQLKRLVETLEKVNEQSSRLTRDSEEMENLNRTLTGITRVYEMQLKSASQQITTIDDINLQTRKMAQQIEQLNQIYARMIEAMTVNMRMSHQEVSPKPDTNGY